MPFEDITIQTGQPPMLVREVYRDYKAGVHGPADSVDSSGGG